VGNPAPFEIEEVELVYVSDAQPGWRRVRKGDDFEIVDARGRPVRDEVALRRVRALAVPPAYEDVWICPLENGHLQATGRDARGRKQYRYHPAWALQQGQTKFERLREFGEALPALRRRVRRDLGQGGLPRDKVLATLVRLLDTTYLRIGNDEYARENGSYGLTTLRCRHAAVRGSRLQFNFRGKSGIRHRIELRDETLARIVRRCQNLPGQDLFQYVDEDGEPHRVGSSDVNAYLREATGGDFTAKDFRTWHASALALERLLAEEAPRGKRDAQQRIKAVIADVAARLGHTVTVCRKSYVHTAVLERFADGRLAELTAGKPAAAREVKAREVRLLALLEAVHEAGCAPAALVKVSEERPAARS
jgi:DNA topoisomerase-1